VPPVADVSGKAPGLPETGVVALPQIHLASSLTAAPLAHNCGGGPVFSAQEPWRTETCGGGGGVWLGVW
jgi:hypothetical protein